MGVVVNWNDLNMQPLGCYYGFAQIDDKSVPIFNHLLLWFPFDA